MIILCVSNSLNFNPQIIDWLKKFSIDKIYKYLLIISTQLIEPQTLRSTCPTVLKNLHHTQCSVFIIFYFDKKKVPLQSIIFLCNSKFFILLTCDLINLIFIVNDFKYICVLFK